MTTLVTGATSGLGRNAAQRLAILGRRVRATGRNLDTGRALQACGIDFIAADLATAQTTDFDRLLDGVDTVWHCAALSSPWGAYEDFHVANVVATGHLVKAAIRHGVRCFVHVSTPSLYFDFRHRLNIPENFRPARYANHYASTKAQAETCIQAAVQRQPATTFVILRPRGIFGPYDRVLVPRILRVLRERKGVLPLPRGGAARLDLTHVDNVVQAMLQASARLDLQSGEVFNITNGEPATLRSMLDALLRPLGVPFRIVSLPYPVVDAVARAMELRAAVTGIEPALTRYSVGALNYDMTLDIGRARQRLGYAPVMPTDEAMSTTVEWIKAHGDDYGL